MVTVSIQMSLAQTLSRNQTAAQCFNVHSICRCFVIKIPKSKQLRLHCSWKKSAYCELIHLVDSFFKCFVEWKRHHQLFRCMLLFYDSSFKHFKNFLLNDIRTLHLSTELNDELLIYTK